MKRVIHISVLILYLITSSCLIATDKWSSGKDTESVSDWLISSLTIPVSDDAGDGDDLPFLFKDPSEDGTIVLNYYPSFTTFEFVSIHYSILIEEKIKDPFLNIFSPPPQLI